MSMLLSRRPKDAPDPAAEVAQAGRAAELARHAADVARADGERRRSEAETDIAVARLRAQAALEDKRLRHADRELARLARRAERKKGRQARVARLRPMVPLVIVNATAMFGQVGAGYDYLTGAGTNIAARLAVAFLVAAAAEIVALYVGWHAHDALLRGDGRTAASLRRASYLIAALMGAVNYSHFADPHLAPTWASVVFGFMSTLSPWLWGLHTRRAQHVQLTAQGRADTAGAVFSGERVRAFPIRSWKARRWSIDHNVSDPIVAWNGYLASIAPGCRCKDLPGVPTAAERALLSDAELNDRAHLTVLAAAANGVPVDADGLAAAYGRKDRWARARIAEARADRTETS